MVFLSSPNHRCFPYYMYLVFSFEHFFLCFFVCINTIIHQNKSKTLTSVLVFFFNSLCFNFLKCFQSNPVATTIA